VLSALALSCRFRLATAQNVSQDRRSRRVGDSGPAVKRSGRMAD
jgi:hypothetical protein